MPDEIASIGIRVDTGGVAAANVALDRLTQASSQATAAVGRLGAGSDAAATAQKVLASTSVATAAQAKVAETAHVALAAAAGRSAAAHREHGAAMVNNRMAMMELEHSIRAVIDGIGAGMSPMRLLAMEGSRLVEAFKMSGGAAGAMSMLGNILGKLANPTVILTGAIAGLGAVGFAAFSAWENRLNGLQVALNGLGRSTGLTLGGLNRVALGSSGGLTSTFQAQSAVAAFAATGRMTPAMIQQMIGGQKYDFGQSQGLVQQFSKVTGTDFGEATKTLAADFSDPTKGAEALDKQFGLLNDRTLQLIANFQASGRVTEAQGVLFRALAQDIQGAGDRTWTFFKIWAGISTGASNALAATGQVIQRFVDPLTEDRLDQARSQVRALEKQAQQPRFGLGYVFGNGAAGVESPELGEARQNEANAGEAYRFEGRIAAQRGERMDAARRSKEAGDIAPPNHFGDSEQATDHQSV